MQNMLQISPSFFFKPSPGINSTHIQAILLSGSHPPVFIPKATWATLQLETLRSHLNIVITHNPHAVHLHGDISNLWVTFLLLTSLSTVNPNVLPFLVKYNCLRCSL